MSIRRDGVLRDLRCKLRSRLSVPLGWLVVFDCLIVGWLVVLLLFIYLLLPLFFVVDWLLLVFLCFLLSFVLSFFS